VQWDKPDPNVGLVVLIVGAAFVIVTGGLCLLSVILIRKNKREQGLQSPLPYGGVVINPMRSPVMFPKN
jgi:hypothetical protein